MRHLIPENINQVPERIGVYKIWAKEIGGKNIKIRRMCAEDVNGLLYIGRTKDQNLKTRLYQFYASAHPVMKTHNHSGGRKYFSREIVRLTLKEHELWFEYEVTDEPKKREKELLNEYCQKFGEYPPLNK